MHLALALTAGRRRCGFRVAVRRLHTLSLNDMSAFLQDVTWTRLACVQRRPQQRSGFTTSCYDAGSDGRACAWNCARNVERDSEHRVCIPAHVQRVRLGRLRAGCEWLEAEAWGGIFLGLFLSDYRDIPMSLYSSAQIEYERTKCIPEP